MLGYGGGMRRIAWLPLLLLLTGCGAPAGHVAATPATRPAATASASVSHAPAGTATAAAAPAAATGTAEAAATGSAPATAPVPGAPPTASHATATASPAATSAGGSSAHSGAGADATSTATAPASSSAARAPSGATSPPPSAPLTPGVWADAGSESACATVLTADLVAYGAAAGPIAPGTGGTLAVYVHNNSNLCGAAGRPISLGATGWRLIVTPLGALAGVAATDLPSPPASLAPGAEVRLPVRIGAGLAPGWYEASVQVPGAGAPPVASLPSLQSIERFLVTAGPRPAGRVTADAYPAPAVGGLSMPLVSVTWSSRNVAVVTVHAALVCGPGTDRYASFTGVTATAAGHGFTTDLPNVGGGQDPAIAQASWDFPFPGEAASLTVAARVQVRACGSGALLGSNGVAWKVDLPG